MFYFKEHYNFPRFQEWGPTLSRGCGSNCICLWIPIELVIFQEGGPDPLSPFWIRACHNTGLLKNFFSFGAKKGISLIA